jgi:hypothetical protein
MPADRPLALWRAASFAGTIFQNVDLGAATLHAHAKPGELGVPKDELSSIGCRLQCIYRAFSDLADHARLQT